MDLGIKLMKFWLIRYYFRSQADGVYMTFKNNKKFIGVHCTGLQRWINVVTEFPCLCSLVITNTLYSHFNGRDYETYRSLTAAVIMKQTDLSLRQRLLNIQFSSHCCRDYETYRSLTASEILKHTVSSHWCRDYET